MIDNIPSYRKGRVEHPLLAEGQAFRALERDLGCRIDQGGQGSTGRAEQQGGKQAKWSHNSLENIRENLSVVSQEGG